MSGHTPPCFQRRIVRAAHYRNGGTWEFVLDAGRLVSRKRILAKTDLIFGPGFFDLQCNGYAGVDFAHPDTTPNQIVTAIKAMRKRGCTHVLPTLITAAPERLELLFRHLNQALQSNEDVCGSVPGYHLEGPFISPIDGARGAHPKEHVVPPSPVLWRRLQNAAQGNIRLVTLAPEIEGALPFIRQLRSEGIVVALGHTLAGCEQIAAAVKAGAVLSTHLGNGCPQQIHRHQNPIFAQLGQENLSASLIADRIHLPTEVLRSFWRVKGPGQIILVTDAMAAADAPPGRYTLGDLIAEVGSDKVVRQSGTENLAGSALTMEAAVSNLMRAAGATLCQAWDAASIQPRKLMSNIKIPGHSFTIVRPTRRGLKIMATILANRVDFCR
ncbi:MAG: N-acetylglucosamine-6-phosphate deacetylase [Chthoniobacteraceae bacterium]|nr:N-acetylglucosamine-6-phosphate deacetylase [Chthoniobacteraceae bacterium]